MLAVGGRAEMVFEESGEGTWVDDEDEEHDIVYIHTVLVEVFDEASGRWFALPDRIGELDVRGCSLVPLPAAALAHVGAAPAN